MKKTSALTTIALCVIICLTSCSDTAKAKKAVKTYLIEDAKTPLVEIYSIGDVTDYPYDFKDTEALEDSIKKIHDYYYGNYESSYLDDITGEYIPIRKYFDAEEMTGFIAEYYHEPEREKEILAQIHELRKQIEEAPVTHYNLKQAEVTLKLQNQYGAYTTENVIFYFDEDITVGAPADPKRIPKKNKK